MEQHEAKEERLAEKAEYSVTLERRLEEEGEEIEEAIDDCSSAARSAEEVAQVSGTCHAELAQVLRALSVADFDASETK